jgi:hypothetical protein
MTATMQGCDIDPTRCTSAANRQYAAGLLTVLQQ